MFIQTYKSGSGLYARVYRAKREDGTKRNECIHHLGKVIDLEKGIFRSRERGLVKYTIENGFEKAPEEYRNETNNTVSLILDFGAEYAFTKALEKDGLLDVYRSFGPDVDTLMTLLLYKMLRSGANCYAEAYWEGSYARILYPNAKIQSQRLSDFLADLGEEATVRHFFKQYLAYVSKKSLSSKHSVLVDSTGLPNDIHLPITAINTHGGVTSNEIRLILVVDRITGRPLYFRYVAGNIVDVSTLIRTMGAMKDSGIDVDHCIVDAGYFSEANIRELMSSHISFLLRLKGGNNLYDNLLRDHVPGLSNNMDHLVLYGERILFMKCVAVQPFGTELYAYVAIDNYTQFDERRKILRKNKKDGMTDEQRSIAIQNCGAFVLLSNTKIELSEVLPLYYTRQTIEQVFDIGKNYTDLLPLRTHNEETFRGHLLISFMATAAILTLNQLLKKPKYKFNGAVANLQNLKCLVYPDRLWINEPTKKMNEVLEELKVQVPRSIPM